MRPNVGQTWRIGRRFETEHTITSLCPRDWAVKQVVFLLAFALKAKCFTVLFTICVCVCVCVCVRAHIHSNVAQQPAAHDHPQLLDSLLLILSEKKHPKRTRPHVSSILLFNPSFQDFHVSSLLILSFSLSHYLSRSHLPDFLIFTYADV